MDSVKILYCVNGVEKQRMDKETFETIDSHLRRHYLRLPTNS